jgi:hypothetical protein
VLALRSPLKHFDVCSPLCNDNGAVLVTVYDICTLIYILRFILSIILNDFTLVTVISMLFDTSTYSSFLLSVLRFEDNNIWSLLG